MECPSGFSLKGEPVRGFFKGSARPGFFKGVFVRFFNGASIKGL